VSPARSGPLMEGGGGPWWMEPAEAAQLQSFAHWAVRELRQRAAAQRPDGVRGSAHRPRIPAPKAKELRRTESPRSGALQVADRRIPGHRSLQGRILRQAFSCRGPHLLVMVGGSESRRSTASAAEIWHLPGRGATLIPRGWVACARTFAPQTGFGWRASKAG